MSSPSSTFDAAYLKDLLGRVGFSAEVQDVAEDLVLVIPPEDSRRGASPARRLNWIIRSLLGSGVEVTTVPAGLLVRACAPAKES